MIINNEENENNIFNNQCCKKDNKEFIDSCSDCPCDIDSCNLSEGSNCLNNDYHIY